jgi:hypothetical protein
VTINLSDIGSDEWTPRLADEISGGGFYEACNSYLRGNARRRTRRRLVHQPIL